eukprot:Nk52_evm69s1444 gene=Nk52_evmTU69s1444
MSVGSGRVQDEAFVTLVTNDEYAQGAFALLQSLKNTGTERIVAVMVTDGVSFAMRNELKQMCDKVFPVSHLDSGDEGRLRLLQRPELGITFTKIYAWTLPYRKCVFLDADTMVLCNIDELFHRNELSAAPDVGWPDCFNSGVFVFEPNADTFVRLMGIAGSIGSFDGGDQGLLNQAFPQWSSGDGSRRLPFVYNMNPNVSYSYLPAYQKFGKNAKIIHFIGNRKPWNMMVDKSGNVVEHTQQGKGYTQMTNGRSDAVTHDAYSNSIDMFKTAGLNLRGTSSIKWDNDIAEEPMSRMGAPPGFTFSYMEDVDDFARERTCWIPPINAGRHRRNRSDSRSRSARRSRSGSRSPASGKGLSPKPSHGEDHFFFNGDMSSRSQDANIEENKSGSYHQGGGNGIMNFHQMMAGKVPKSFDEMKGIFADMANNSKYNDGSEASFVHMWHEVYNEFLRNRGSNGMGGSDVYPITPTQIENDEGGFGEIQRKLDNLMLQNPLEMAVDNKFDQLEWILSDIFERLKRLRKVAKANPGALDPFIESLQDNLEDVDMSIDKLESDLKTQSMVRHQLHNDDADETGTYVHDDKSSVSSLPLL